jgi:hypothetical protein
MWQKSCQSAMGKVHHPGPRHCQIGSEGLLRTVMSAHAPGMAMMKLSEAKLTYRQICGGVATSPCLMRLEM